jgi:hypothetical protein
MSDDTRKYFESVAPKWDEMRRLFFGEGVRYAAIAAANITPSSIVADVGTVRDLLQKVLWRQEHA